jgi:nitroreductase
MPCCEEPVEKAIRHRRSIRRYKADMPPAAWIETMIACAGMAPSPSNSQPVRFVRIISPEVRNDLHQTMIRRHQELLQTLEAKGAPKRIKNILNASFRYSEFMFHAPVLIAVGTIGPVGGFTTRLTEAGILPENTRGETDLDISVGLAVKGLLLKGEALGLGTCVLTAPLIFLADVESRIGIEDIHIKCFVAAGFADETPPFIDRQSVAQIYREV